MGGADLISARVPHLHVLLLLRTEAQVPGEGPPCNRRDKCPPRESGVFTGPGPSACCSYGCVGKCYQQARKQGYFTEIFHTHSISRYRSSEWTLLLRASVRGEGNGHRQRPRAGGRGTAGGALRDSNTVSACRAAERRAPVRAAQGVGTRRGAWRSRLPQAYSALGSSAFLAYFFNRC